MGATNRDIALEAGVTAAVPILGGLSPPLLPSVAAPIGGATIGGDVVTDGGRDDGVAADRRTCHLRAGVAGNPLTPKRLRELGRYRFVLNGH